jgi:RHS repeat-associated protein
MTRLSILRRWRLLAVLAALGSLILGGVALAQEEIPPPRYTAIDGNGVDLITGTVMLDQAVVSVGPKGPGGLSYKVKLRAGSAISLLDSYVSLSVDADIINERTTVVVMGETQVFEGTPQQGATPIDGSTGSVAVVGNRIVYTGVDGTVAKFALVQLNYQRPWIKPRGRAESVTFPSGEILTFTYGDGVYTLPQVESSLGYALGMILGGYTIDGVGANLTQGGCSGGVCSGPTFANQFALGRALQGTSTVGGGQVTYVVTNPAGGQRTYISGDKSRVLSFTNGVGTWTYSYAEAIDDTYTQDGILTVTVTNPLGHKRIVKSRMSNQHIISDDNGLQNQPPTTFQYSYDSYRPGWGDLVQITYPEGNKQRYEYDANRNVIAKWHDPKPNQGLAPTVARASYSCHGVVCNKPDWIRDERENQTDFTYDDTHGGVLTVTRPAPVAGGVRPQTRYTYGQFTARYISGGAWIVAPPVWRLTQTSTCQTLAGETPATPTTPKIPAACLGTADEVVTAFVYENSAVANNVRLLSTTTRAGNAPAAEWATTTFAYDARGNVTAVDGPLPGAADTTRTYYDASRWKEGEIGPDPDGAGALLHRASRTTYAADGGIISAEVGTATSQADNAMASFAPLQRTDTVYDNQRRKVSDSLVVNGVTETVTQYGYDAANRPVCQTVRMNSAAFGSAPGACTLGAVGGDGPDRITYTVYDAANRIDSVYSGYGTPQQRREIKNHYFPNGNKQYVVDGAGNTTQYVYDGLDRLSTTYFSVAAVGTGATNGADFEQYGYDAAGNPTSWRKRSGETVTATYDALNRMTYKDGPKGWYYYDNLDRPTYTYAGDAAEKIIAHYYDGLGRPSHTYDYRDGTWFPTYTGYDLAGRLTTLQWSDGNYVNYDYDAAGGVVGVRENNSIYLATFGYDNLGRRTYLSRGNGVTTWYGYDNASRLGSLSHDLAGTAQDQSFGRAYTAASQVRTQTSSNAAYDWSWAQTTKSYTINGLNQVTAAGATPLSYDGRGNLAHDGARAFGYDLDNHLTSAGGATLSYDPLGRLGQITSAAATRFVYSGSSLIAELNTSNAVLRRYVPGPGTDEPLVWYEGSGMSDRRWLLADERGSIVAVTNGAGAAAQINTYDEYGIPAAGNQGRFQYTGQVWIPELGLYHYKARAYSPTLGRFLQTDPSGYDDGLNWYAYVGNDPLNQTDPTGRQAVDWVTVTWERWGRSVGRNEYESMFGGTHARACGAGCQQAKADWTATREQFDDDYGDYFLCAAMCAVGAPELLAGGISLAGRALAGDLLKACNCFEAGTLVAVDGGYKPIEEIAVGDLVLSRDDETGETALKPVAALIPGKKRVIWDVIVETKTPSGEIHRDTIHTTEEHPFRTADNIWTPAAQLKAGASIQTIGQASATVLQVRKTERIVRTYNLEIADFHTYFVGSTGLWVHNACNILWKLGDSSSKTLARMTRQLQQRGWTGRQITQAVKSGQKFPATNNLNPANGATRYVHPTTGQSVVIDNSTRQVIHVGGPGYKY